MSQPHRFEMLGDIAIFRVSGETPFSAAMQSITAAIKAARQQRIGKLMVVTLQLSTMKAPSIATRHFLAREWAHAAGADMRVVIVAAAEMMDPQKLGVIVARNFGATANAFASEAEAIAWLQGSD